jgi:hypothetical protein
MRKTVRLFSALGPTERLGRAIAALPVGVQRTLREVAGRRDLALAAGSWRDDDGGCLVANAVACLGATTDEERTLDLRMLDAFPQMSSRDLNLLIVAWDEAATQAAASSDDDLRSLLSSGLAWAGVDMAAPPPGGVGDGADSVPATAGDRP